MANARLAMIVALLFLVPLCGFSFADPSPAPAASRVSNLPLAPDQGGAQSLDEGAGADQGEPAAESSASTPAAAPAIPPGTVINSSNWMQYKDHFSEGEIGLWEGKWFWKMPPDAQITVGPTKVYPLPAPFVEASEKYGDQTRLEKLANGRWLLKNYVAGAPFPIPDDPDKGQKILTNLNYRIQPHLIAGFPDSGTTLSVCNMDELQDIFCWH